LDEQGLWNLFFATGSPLVWLAMRQLEREKLAKTALGELRAQTVEI